MKVTCPHCGHVSAIYVHKLNKGMIRAFDKVCEEFIRTGCAVPVKKFPALGMTHNQQANFQKLRYFGIVTNQSQEGWWEPTGKGLGFWSGTEAIDNRVATQNGKPLERDHDCWKSIQVLPQKVRIREIDDQLYKTRQEYRDDKQGQLTLLD